MRKYYKHSDNQFSCVVETEKGFRHLFLSRYSDGSFSFSNGYHAPDNDFLQTFLEGVEIATKAEWVAIYKEITTKLNRLYL